VGHGFDLREKPGSFVAGGDTDQLRQLADGCW